MEVSAKSYLSTDRATIKIMHDENDKDFKVLYNNRVKSGHSDIRKDTEAMRCAQGMIKNIEGIPLTLLILSLP